MEIVEYGNIKPIGIICNECKAVLKYTQTDVSFNVRTGVLYVRCPVCGSRLPVKNKK